MACTNARLMSGLMLALCLLLPAAAGIGVAPSSSEHAAIAGDNVSFRIKVLDEGGAPVLAALSPEGALAPCLTLSEKSVRFKSGELSQIGPDHAGSVLDEMEDNFFEEEPYQLVQPALEPGVLDMEGVDEQLSFSPLQKRITKVLIEGNRTAKQLAEILATTEGSIGKQLSLLTERRIVKVVNHRRPKLYGVSDEFRGDLAAL